MKNKFIISIMVLLVFAMNCIPVLAIDQNTANGFYNIGTAENILITPYAGDRIVTAKTQDVDNDEKPDQWYVNSDRLEVSYSAAARDAYYGVILVEGSDLPTKDNAIFYIDQMSTDTDTIDFNVYPILPEETTDLTLYISSNLDGFELIEIPLNYVVGAPLGIYTPGDVDNDGIFGVKDALLVLQIGVGKYPATEAEKAAADVDKDGVYGVKDALLILQYGTGKISSFN